jgi:hypothetical protein
MFSSARNRGVTIRGGRAAWRAAFGREGGFDPCLDLGAFSLLLSQVVLYLGTARARRGESSWSPAAGS